jgi:hypothetical protein
MAMDMDKNIALAYNLSGTNNFPSLAYTGRYAIQNPGQMYLQEQIAMAGTAAQSGGNRFGDY